MSDELVTTDTGEELPVDTANVGEAAPLEPASPPPSVTTPEPEPTSVEVPEPEPTFRLPGQSDVPVNEADWLRHQYANSLTQMQQLQQQLQELQFKDVPEEERAAYQQQQEVAQLRQYVEQMQAQQANNEWQAYWAQFVPDPAPIRALADPIQMAHHVATTLHGQARNLAKTIAQKDAEIAALKKSVGIPQQGPVITTNSTGATVRPTFKDLMKDPAALDRLYKRAAMGLLEDSEIPPL